MGGVVEPMTSGPAQGTRGLMVESERLLIPCPCLVVTRFMMLSRGGDF